MSGYSLRVEIRELPACNTSRNAHWRVKSNDRQVWTLRLLAAMTGKPKPPAPLELAAVTFTRHSSRRPDYCNLVGSFKLLEDLLQPQSTRNPGGIGVIAGDKPENYVGGHADYQWAYAKRGEGRVTIEVTEAEANGEEQDS